jgi:hypothetical protein
VNERLEGLSGELESVAAKLRAGDVDADEAATLVERCAELAAELGSELDAESRSATESEGQERLL